MQLKSSVLHSVGPSRASYGKDMKQWAVESHIKTPGHAHAHHTQHMVNEQQQICEAWQMTRHWLVRVVVGGCQGDWSLPAPSSAIPSRWHWLATRTFPKSPTATVLSQLLSETYFAFVGQPSAQDVLQWHSTAIWARKRNRSM